MSVHVFVKLYDKTIQRVTVDANHKQITYILGIAVIYQTAATDVSLFCQSMDTKACFQLSIYNKNACIRFSLVTVSRRR